MVDEKPNVYKCPYCADVSYGGQPGKSNLTKHVKFKHPDKFKEFKKLQEQELISEKPLPETRIVEPQPTAESKEKNDVENSIKKMFDDLKKEKDDWRKEREQYKQQLQQQPVQQQQTTVETPPTEYVTTAPLPAFIDELPPAEFIKKFLAHYQCKPLFIQMMVDSANMSGHPPDVPTLIQSLKTMDSGHNKTALQCEWIGQMYDKRLQQYWKRQEELKKTKYQSAYPPQPQYNQYGSLIQPSQNPYPYQQQPPQNFPPFPQYPGSQYNALMGELKKLTDERERLREKELQDIKNQLAQKREIDPQMVQMQQRIQDLAEDNKRLAQENANKDREALLSRIERIGQYAQSAPTIEAIENLITKKVTDERDRFTGTDLKQYVDGKFQDLAQQRGTTQLDVELKKAEHEMEIEKAKIASEEKKTDAWGENLRGIADVAGEAIGRGIASIGSSQPQMTPPSSGPTEPTAVNQVICPSCGASLKSEPGVTDASCGNCNARFIINPDGTTQPLGQKPTMSPKPAETQPPPLVSQAGFTVETQTSENQLSDRTREKTPSGTYEPPVPVSQFYEPKTPPSPQTAKEPPVRKQPPPAEQKKPIPEQKPTEQKPLESDYIGPCNKCGNPVYNENIAKTDHGKVYCKDCA